MTEEELQDIEQRLAASMSRDLFGQEEAQMMELLIRYVPRLIDAAREAGQ